MSILKKKKSELIAIVRELARQNQELRRELDSIADHVVPYIAEYDVPKGETVMVRMPKRFKVSEA